MSFTLQSALIYLQQNDYVSLAIITAVLYDYVLTVSNEIEYIWIKPWSSVSTSFVLVRYAGIFTLVTNCLSGSSFMPGPSKMYVFVLLSLLLWLYRSLYPFNSCEIINKINVWTFLLFLGAADFVMILRVWVMWNRSRVILSSLLSLFALEIISILADAVRFSILAKLPVSTPQIFDIPVCVLQITSDVSTQVTDIVQMTHGAALCILAVVQFMRQSFQMYRVTKQWQANRYMNLLVKQGILYFIGIFLYTIYNICSSFSNSPTEGWRIVLLAILTYVPSFTLTPRLILSIRKLYAHDVQGRRGGGIDTGFGLSTSGCGAVATTIMFADVEKNHESDSGIEEIRIEDRTTP